MPGDMVRGRVWRFGDDISTDLLSPGSYATEPIEVRRLHALESVNASFASGVRAGDVVVAGRNFGCGSSRETAPEALKSLDVGCVVAESFARLFLRNAVAIGLPVLTCAGAAHAFSDGEEVEVNLATGGVRSKVGGADLAGNPLPEEMRRILAAGGILALLRAGSADETHSSHAPKES